MLPSDSVTAVTLLGQNRELIFKRVAFLSDLSDFVSDVITLYNVHVGRTFKVYCMDTVSTNYLFKTVITVCVFESVLKMGIC